MLIYNNTGEYGSAISLGEPLGLVIDDINMTITQSTITNNQGGFSFGLTDEANSIDLAVRKSIDSGFRTGDIFTGEEGTKKVNTLQMGDAILSNL